MPLVVSSKVGLAQLAMPYTPCDMTWAGGNAPHYHSQQLSIAAHSYRTALVHAVLTVWNAVPGWPGMGCNSCFPCVSLLGWSCPRKHQLSSWPPVPAGVHMCFPLPLPRIKLGGPCAGCCLLETALLSLSTGHCLLLPVDATSMCFLAWGPSAGTWQVQGAGLC